MAKPIESTPTLRGKDAERFLKRMIEREKDEFSETDKKFLKGFD